MALRVVLLHPEIANRSCEDCQTWHYDDAPDKFAPTRETILARGAARTLLRSQIGSKPLCFACPKQRPDTPESARSPETAVEMSERGWRAYTHFKECRAVGVFPSEDAIVRTTAVICRDVEEMVAELRRIKLGGI